MYVYEEIINNEKLTNIINTIHENVKYLPGHKIPENVASIFIKIYNIIPFIRNRYSVSIAQ